MRIQLSSFIGCCSLAALSVATNISAQDISTTLAYDSKYVTEGRDNLGEGGLFSIELAAEFESGISAGVWFADADDLDYDETNLFIEYSFSAGSLDMYVGYTHLIFNEGESDDEIGFGVASNDLDLDLAVDFVYSEEANGFFAELSGAKSFELSDNLVLSPYLLIAFDYGYASANHDGENNYQFGVDAEYTLSDSLSLTSYIYHSIAAQDVKLDGGGDETWAGIALGYSL